MEVRVTRSNPDELYHFKYIKREKKNGKWVYYYDTKQLKRDVSDALGVDEQKEYKKASSNERNAMFKYAAANVDEKDAYKRPNTDDHRNSKKYKNDYNKAAREYVKRDKEYRKAQEKTKKAYNKFKKTPIGAAYHAVNVGAKLVSKLFDSN